MSVALASSSTPSLTRGQPLRVMVVDDSAVIRGLISRWISAEPDMVVAASLRTGLDAVLAKKIQEILVAMTDEQAAAVLPKHYTGFIASTNANYKPIEDAGLAVGALKKAQN